MHCITVFMRQTLLLLCVVGSHGLWGASDPASESFPYVRQPTWSQTVTASRAAWSTSAVRPADRAAALAVWWQRLEDDFPVECDWVLQDGRGVLPPWLNPHPGAEWERLVIGRAMGDLRCKEEASAALGALLTAAPVPEDPRWLELYAAIAARRRAERLEVVQDLAPRIAFTKRRTVRPSFLAYTEGASDAQHERHFLPGAELCLLEFEGPRVVVRTLLSDPTGVIRDPAVSWNGERLVFAWKKSLNDDDYHLYEIELHTGQIRQLTFGRGFADYEPAFLPNGDLIFASTRCVQTVDCWWTEVSNLYTCDADGRYLRRLGFDQVHTVFPQLLDDGRVIYTRWDYNDRGQTFPQPLFQMNPDGTGQAEFYGNSSWFPTTIAHARGIPGTGKVVAILCGHHSSQAGKLAIIDPARGRQENQGVQQIAPVRPTPAERIDAYGQEGELWQYPYPLNEREFLVTYSPDGWEGTGPRRDDAAFGIYWMDVDGRRELLIKDARLPCQQPVPVVARPRPPERSSLVNHQESTGTYYIQDVHTGAGLAGIPRGTVARLRVVALDFRAAGIGHNGSHGPGGDALISTPVAIGNGSWDVKVVLGEIPVQPDGSALFKVPARTPLYFQALDSNGHAVQTMRSWSTLQPGEIQSCVGCHDPRNSAPPTHGALGRAARGNGPEALEPFYGPPRGFSFPKEIQPILDRHCVSCHDDRSLRPARRRLTHAIARESDPQWIVQLPLTYGGTLGVPRSQGPPPAANQTERRSAFSLLCEGRLDPVAKRYWSDAYLNLTLAYPPGNDQEAGAFAGIDDGQMVNWISSQSIPAPLPPYAAGAARSGLFSLLAQGHYGLQLSREDLDKLACWVDLLVPYCGDYAEASAWDPEEQQKYRRFLDKRREMEHLERRNIEALLATEASQ
jgi:hypothetical protein